jgi:hypothetical protein
MGGEPHRLLGPDAEDDEVTRGPKSRVHQPRGKREPHRHAGRAVEIAAMRHAVEMAADHAGRQRPVTPRQRHHQRADGIDRDLKAEAFGKRAGLFVRHPLARAVARARHARRVCAAGSECGEECACFGKRAAFRVVDRCHRSSVAAGAA